MRNLVIVLLAFGLMFAVGCVNEETSKADKNLNTVTDVDQLQAELLEIKGQLDSQKAKYEAEITKLREENIEIQNTAMKTIMTMLQKQIDHDNKIQDKLKNEISKLQETNTQLQTQIKQLESSVSENSQAKKSELVPVS